MDTRIAAIIMADSLFWVTHSNFNYLQPLLAQNEHGQTRTQAATLMTTTTAVLMIAQLILPLAADKQLINTWMGYLLGLIGFGTSLSSKHPSSQNLIRQKKVRYDV